MVAFNDFLLLLDGYLSGSWWFPAFLIGTGIYFTAYLGFPQFKFFAHGWRIVTGKYAKEDTKGETSPFEALTTAMSGAVGTGNIGGVALAIWIGGPAAIFWMWITAIFGMTTKFVEVTMAHKYRTTLTDGSISGGPMYYIEKGFNKRWAGVIFAALMMICAIGSGNMPQINNIAVVLDSTFSIPKLATGLILGVMLWLIIAGGIKRIAKIASKLVPVMAVIYFGGALVVIVENYQNIIPSLHSIFSQVFSGSAAAGGFLGASFAMSLKLGVARGLYSNEAGQGSSPIAHASAKAEHSVEQGMVSILEPFIDTIVVCSVTALVILSSGAWTQKYENTFERSSMAIFDGSYTESNEGDVEELGKYILDARNFTSNTTTVKNYSGNLNIVDGLLQQNDITIFHNNSIAEDVQFIEGGEPFTGSLEIIDGDIENSSIKVEGKSLIHSAELTSKAFASGVLGMYGEYIVAIGLLLFAFSTAIAWSYYGDRSTAYIFGEAAVPWYRMIYVVSFIAAAVIDTTIIWNIAYVVVALVTIPNLIALFVLRKEMKEQVTSYVMEK
ncbi:sodium:alanine symporter family protein [Gammaproteobacteria bacterium]|mgnify:FL=1|nr:sodium:alanine symporter family protein [Gammaproteobacteria bacterium]MDA8925563.1 sodium:alanine symporter family protein [Gammaproteobacteria bacterium]MDA9340434.1 sodium:alanine symporter family protein [Gammaproteobacteria bacterium]MDA9370739.1 sodium:alanine symporter family protein [Gammaproteobacteria bacterium]MDB9700539.1 sodium:alanine symporter family protein [Gammaproteobacteria bacterium]|tara:strand:+ start:296 stop:1960 length:1665 start_codon:yes stop_codon:yes gene_type:complete